MLRNPLPQELSARLTKQFGPGAFERMLKAFAAPRKTTLRVNTLKTSDDAVMQTFRDEQIAFERIKDIPHAFMIKNRSDEQMLDHALTKEGKIYLQGIASMIPPLVLDPQPSDLVLDLCAAPGSKTTQLAALGAKHLTACEDNGVRFQKLQNTISIQGADVDARHVDATLLHHDLPEYFDKILADVPCTAEGRIECSDVRTFKFWSQKNINEHAKLQRRLLRSAVRMLKPGGQLVYSTCTLAPEENELMTQWLVTEFPEMKPEPFSLPLPSTKKVAHGVILLPTEQHEGFFVAKFIKKD